MNNPDSFEFIDRIKKQILEDEEEFIYRSISPYCESIIEKKISKKELEKILYRGMQPSIPLDKVKQARDTIQYMVDNCGNDTVTALNMQGSLKAALAMLDNLIAESENNND